MTTRVTISLYHLALKAPDLIVAIEGDPDQNNWTIVEGPDAARTGDHADQVRDLDRFVEDELRQAAEPPSYRRTEDAA